MRRSLLTMLTIALTLTVVLSALCSAAFLAPLVPAPPSSNMPGGCHGHDSLPLSSHECCYAGHQPPAAVQLVPSPAALDLERGSVTVADLAGSHTSAAVAVERYDSSPPLNSVLRI